MKRYLIFAVLLLFAVVSAAQTTNGSITTSATTCATAAACVILPLNNNSGSATIVLGGTFTGTLQFLASADNTPAGSSPDVVAVNCVPPSSSTAVTSSTGAGTWKCSVGGMTHLIVRASALASGTVLVNLNASPASASSGLPATFDQIGSGTNTTAAMVVGSGASLAATGTGTIAATSLAGFSGTLHDIPVGTGGSLTDSIGLSESYPTFTVNESQAVNGTSAHVGDITTAQLTAPSVLACVQGASTGGFLLHNQAYFYKVTAISANGQTTVSNESTFTTAASPVGDTYTASCTWTGHTGDTGYKLYRSTTTGAELLLATVTPGNTNSYTDNTSTTPSGAMPTANNTGSLSLAGLIPTYNGIATAGTGLESVQAAPAAITIGSGASIAATSLCSTTLCPAGDYDIGVFINITTACSTTGGYIVWLGWTDDQGAKTGSSTTTFFPLNGTGTTPSTGSLALASTANYGQGGFYLHITGAATGGLGSINYGTTAVACGTGGPMVGKMYFTVTRRR